MLALFIQYALFRRAQQEVHDRPQRRAGFALGVVFAHLIETNACQDAEDLLQRTAPHLTAKQFHQLSTQHPEFFSDYDRLLTILPAKQISEFIEPRLIQMSQIDAKPLTSPEARDLPVNDTTGQTLTEQLLDYVQSIQSHFNQSQDTHGGGDGIKCALSPTDIATAQKHHQRIEAFIRTRAQHFATLPVKLTEEVCVKLSPNAQLLLFKLIETKQTLLRIQRICMENLAQLTKLHSQ
jgi:hypothetical protein